MEACAKLGLAQTTFGRLAVNDGKFVNRLQQGGRVTLPTIERVHAFIERQGGAAAGVLRSALPSLGPEIQPKPDFRFYDNRQKYLMFVNTSSEKQVVANLAITELADSRPRPPAIRLFDGGAGDSTALARILRGMHSRYRWLPFYVVAKEISMENVRLTLDKMPDRFQEHPATVLVVTNLKYSEAPWLQPSAGGAAAMVWHEVALQGSAAGEFEEQVAALRPFLAQNWQASISSRSGNPVYHKPVVLVLYREDHRFLLDSILPRRGLARADFDLALLSQPYRARAALEFKARRIIAPLVRGLGPGGRLVGIHSHGNDPGLEIVQSIWPDENPFVTDRHTLMRAVRRELGGQARDFKFGPFSDSRAIFRYEVHTLPSETAGDRTDFGTSTLFGAWIAATYVAQIEDPRLAEAMTSDRYLEATRHVLRHHNGLWFNDELYVISRRPDFA